MPSHPEASSPQRTLPGWLATLLILISLGAAGLLVYRWFLAPAEEVVIGVDDPPVARVDPRYATEGVHRTGESVWMVKGGAGLMTVRIPRIPAPTTAPSTAPAPSPHFAFRYIEARDVLTSEQEVLFNARQRVRLTPDQSRRLRRLGPPGEMELTDSDRAALVGLWNDYHSQTTDDVRRAFEQKLVNALRDVARRNVEPSRAAAQRDIEQFQSILTAEQMAQLASPTPSSTNATR
ncbi:MAG: hypothetical protein ACREIT_09480 [Tepidisphaeraceae bacterium]